MTTPAPTLRPFALVRTHDQWLRAAHVGTYLDPAMEVVGLDWTVPPTGDARTAPPPPLGAGLAFDAECRLYHSVPDGGRVQKLLWAAGAEAQPTDFIGAPERA